MSRLQALFARIVELERERDELRARVEEQERQLGPLQRALVLDGLTRATTGGHA